MSCGDIDVWRGWAWQEVREPQGIGPWVDANAHAACKDPSASWTLLLQAELGLLLLSQHKLSAGEILGTPDDPATRMTAGSTLESRAMTAAKSLAWGD